MNVASQPLRRHLYDGLKACQPVDSRSFVYYSYYAFVIRLPTRIKSFEFRIILFMNVLSSLRSLLIYVSNFHWQLSFGAFSIT